MRNADAKLPKTSLPSKGALGQMPPSGQLMMQLSILSQLFSTRMNKRLAKQGFTLSQLSILSHVARHSAAQDTQTISQISDAVEVLQPAVTKTIARFEKLKLVEVAPDPNDARVRRVKITPEGGQKLGALIGEMRPDAAAWQAVWSAEEIGKMQQEVGRLNAWLDANRLD